MICELSIAGRGLHQRRRQVNFPDGEVFTSPVETLTRGHVAFSYPAVYGGREVNDVELWFEGGRVVKSTAGKGEEFLEQMLNTDEGARRLGEIAIGTNPGIRRFTKNTLLDEKIAGHDPHGAGPGFPWSAARTSRPSTGTWSPIWRRPDHGGRHGRSTATAHLSAE